jgi:hypothetical protein
VANVDGLFQDMLHQRLKIRLLVQLHLTGYVN